jgi:hypothetical protein
LQATTKSIKWPLITSLGVIAAVIVSLNYFGQDGLALATNALNLGIIVPFATLSLILAARNKITGSFGKAWICFAVFAISWSIGEAIWAMDELVFEQDPFPSVADFFWLLGYPAYFVFAISYIKPFKNSISKKIIALAVSVSAALMAFLVYCAITKSELTEFETALLASYPIGDAICLIPTIIGLALFFRGQVNFTWLLLLVGMFSFVVADSAYQIISQTSQYYTGHPFDIVYIWAYVFFAFGIYHHITVFRVQNQERRFHDQQSLR